MKEQKQDMKLPKLDDLFTTQEERDYAVAEKVQEINISDISDFSEHPFKVNDDDKMKEMVKSVNEYGVILPVIVRPKENGTYEMISGQTIKNTYEIAITFKTIAYSDNGFKYYNYTNFYDEDEFNSFVSECRNLEFYNTSIDLKYTDKLITLSTCEYSQKNGRMVIVAKKI